MQITGVESKKKILLVEDDSFLAGMYVSKLNLEDFKVSLADNGEDGLKLAQEQLPDLVLLDILLPQMDGFEVLKRLKDDPKTAKIPVILLTNLGQKKDVDRGLALGAEDYLIKAHFMPNEVIAKIKKILKS
ncbi:MAG: response regulator [Candidatus Kerfeldbacteria bacterium CG_4_10_14_0_8_um_filter_42_10]|uniref:Response regulator n=1 Tax=Candidatus Kerfeldbacteria bacterium CG_4_10_14_0_8_um_filter_42_10 TaxID=2014248 RepID=A0A2M7RKM1_9BACT|nr:MAG: response regulator [Candidatus Kerfeldbacteria bacterium CG_4_10_14_0_8_um_filter_42_10]